MGGTRAGRRCCRMWSRRGGTRSVGCGASRSRWRFGSGGITLPQLASRKVLVVVEVAFWVTVPDCVRLCVNPGGKPADTGEVDSWRINYIDPWKPREECLH